MHKKTQATYERPDVVSEYDRQCVAFWKRFPRWIVKDFKLLLGEDSSVLNIGSGPGRDSIMLEESGINVTCMDISNLMARRTADFGFPSIQADLVHLPFMDASFEGLWEYKTLVHAGNKVELEQALLERRRVLKPRGGYSIGLIKGRTHTWKVTKTYDAERKTMLITAPKMRKLLTNFGFIIQDDIVPIDHGNTTYLVANTVKID